MVPANPVVHGTCEWEAVHLVASVRSIELQPQVWALHDI